MDSRAFLDFLKVAEKLNVTPDILTPPPGGVRVLQSIAGDLQ